MAFFEIEERTPEWHAQRAKYIGGSEIGALFGCQLDAADSVFSLHYVKRGKVPPDHQSNGRAWWGSRKEAVIARAAAEARGWKIQKGRYATDETTPGMGASLDYEIIGAGDDAEGVATGPVLVDGDQIGRVIKGIKGPLVGPGVLQIKIVDWKQHRDKWIGEQVPDYVALQVQHELACAGYSWGVIAVEIGGNELGFYFYHARPRVIDNIRRLVTEFWEDVAAARPPNPDGSESSARVLRELFPKLVDTEAEPIDLSHDNELPDICADVASFGDQRLHFEKLEKEAKNKLKAKMGRYTHAFCIGYRIKASVAPAKPGRLAMPGEKIGAKAEVRKYTVKEIMA